MKKIKTFLLLLFSMMLSTFSVHAETIELTKDNPNTLISTNSKNYRIQDIKLGLTHEEAWSIINSSSLFLGEQDADNIYRIYVYTRNNDGTKGKPLLYLIWEPSEKEMSRITFFQGVRNYLSERFRRLLTFEAIDDKSDFKRNFIGYANRSKVTLNLPSIDLKHTTYFFDEIGLEIIKKHSSDGEEIIFSIVQPKL